jgi:hypothetical protein
MNRLIILLTLITALALFVPAATGLACSMNDQSDGHMMPQDATIHDNTGHMDHQGDPMDHQSGNSLVAPESNTEQVQPLVKPESTDQQSSEKTGIQGYKSHKRINPHFHTHSRP